MKLVIAGTLLLLCGCGKGTSPAPSTSASTQAAASQLADLPPADPIDRTVPAFVKAAPAAGIYQFSDLEPTNLWISGHAQGADARLAEIQLARLDYPFPPSPSPPELHEDIARQIGKSIQSALSGGEFRFVPTFWGYQGPGQVGGVIYLSNGHTLQDLLLSEGLARVDRNPSRDFQSAAFAPALLDYWITCEDAAKAQKKGFWASHPELMQRN